MAPACKSCNDTGQIFTAGRGVRQCECLKLKAIARRLDAAGIPPRYQRKTFDQYDGSQSPSMGGALTICRGFATEWPMNRHLGMVLAGPPGVGKTHLVCVVIMECAKNWGATVKFADLPELLAKVKATFSNRVPVSESEVLRPMLDADILAIDEVDAARLSEWNFATVEYILGERYNRDKSTILTTNSAVQPAGWTPSAKTAARPQLVTGQATFAEMANMMPATAAMRRETLGDRIGARMFSRVMEMARVVEIDGPDQRAEAGRRRTS